MRDIASSPPRPVGRASLVALEALAGVVVALGSTCLSMAIAVNPMARVGQVSGLAALQLRFIAVAIVIALVWLAVVRWVSDQVALRLAAGSLAGQASGLYAGGIAVSLRGTYWPLHAINGDSGQLQDWAVKLQHGRPIPSVYRPRFPHVLSYWTEFLNPASPVRRSRSSQAPVSRSSSSATPAGSCGRRRVRSPVPPWP